MIWISVSICFLFSLDFEVFVELANPDITIEGKKYYRH